MNFYNIRRQHNVKTGKNGTEQSSILPPTVNLYDPSRSAWVLTPKARISQAGRRTENSENAETRAAQKAQARQRTETELAKALRLLNSSRIKRKIDKIVVNPKATREFFAGNFS